MEKDTKVGLNVGPQEPTIRYSKQMKGFLSFLWQSGRKWRTLKSFKQARSGGVYESENAGWSLQRMGKELFDRGLVLRSEWNTGYRYGLTEKGKKLVEERKWRDLNEEERSKKGLE